MSVYFSIRPEKWTGLSKQFALLFFFFLPEIFIQKIIDLRGRPHIFIENKVTTRVTTSPDKQFKWSRVEVTVFPRAKQLLTKRRKTKNCSSNVQNERKKTRPIHVHYNKVWLNFLIGFTKCEKKLSVKLWSWNSWRMQPKEHRKLCRYHFLVNSLLHFYNSRILKQKVLLQKIMFVKN